MGGKQAHLDHFFRSSLVQALFYGLFSAWVMAARQGKAETFSHAEAGDYLRVPVINLLFDQMTAKQLGKLGMRESVERAVSLLRRVDAESFLKSFREGEAVTYFFEPFLDAFDPGLREELGVWYTPPELIAYQIRHVHQLLQTHLNIPDGLLDERVTILDPATGTGGYLLELGRFLQTEMQKQGKSRIGAQLKKAFTTRIFGFELLPAPFTIAHLQLALMLQDAKGELNNDERVGVLLTNSLNGWTDHGDKRPPVFPELAREQEAAENIKQSRQIMVVLGNPPYSRFAEMPDNPEEQALIAPYKQCLRESWGVKKQLLDDLYIRFLRLAEWRVAEHGQEGIVSFITNRSYLTGISHPVMREHLLKRYDHIYIDDLHGNQRANKVGDGSVFTTATNGGIRVGVSIGTFVKKAAEQDAPSDELAQVHYREFRGSGASKRQQLAEDEKKYATAFVPKREHRYVLRPIDGEGAYWKWPSIAEVFPVRFSGVQAARDGVAIGFASEIDKKIAALKNKNLSDMDFVEMFSESQLEKDGTVKGRSEFRKSELSFDVMDYNFRPFDTRKVIWSKDLLIRDRPEYKPHIKENLFLIINQIMENIKRMRKVSLSSIEYLFQSVQ